jgi:type II secretory pathway pseudopilin PulG
MVNGNEIEKGFVQVSKSYNGFDVDSFELVFFGNNIDWVKGAAEKNVNSLDFANNAQVYNVANINLANNSDLPAYEHCYPYISRGGHLSQNDTKVEDYYPCFYLTGIINRGLNSLGYTVNSTFLNSSNVKKLACDLNGDMKVAQSVVDASRTRASKTSDQTVSSSGAGVITFNDDSTVPNEDNGNNYNTSTNDYIAPTTGRYTFTVSLIIGDYTLLGGLTSFNLDVKIMKDNFIEKARVTQTFSPQTGQQTKEYTLTTLLNAGDEIRVYYEWVKPLNVGFDIKTGSYFKAQRSYELVENDNFSLNEVIPDNIKLLDVINDFTRMFNIYYWTDVKTKTIYLEPRDTFFLESTGALDWSNKLDLSNNYEIDYVSSYKRDIKFSYKDLDNDEWLKGWQDTNKRKYAEYTHPLPSRFGEGTTEVKLDLFSASYAHIAAEATPLNSNAFTTLKYWNKYLDNNDNIQVTPPTHRIDSYNSRIFNFIKNQQTEPNGELREYSLNGVSSTFTPYGIFENYNNTTPNINLSFTGDDGLFTTYYSKMLKNIEEGGRLVAYFNLSSTDFDNLDFRKLVYIDAPIQAKGYYLIESVDDYNPINNGLTKVSLFKFENLGSVPTDGTQKGNNNSDDDNADTNILEPIFIEDGNNLIEVWNEIDSSIGTGYKQVFKD